MSIKDSYTRTVEGVTQLMLPYEAHSFVNSKYAIKYHLVICGRTFSSEDEIKRALTA